MPVNIEIKARLRSRKDVEERAATLADGPARILSQEDTFFPCREGRLKLRIEGGDKGQLIYYLRADERDPKPSTYHVLEIPDPQTMKSALEQALGIKGHVVKERTLYLAGETRIHLDRVKGLGDFMELEVVLGEDLSQSQGIARADFLMKALGIPGEDLVRGAYIDLLAEQKEFLNDSESAAALGAP